MRAEVALRGRRILTDAGLGPAMVRIAAGRFLSIDDFAAGAEAERVIDTGDRVVMPGLVDTHVHVNEPGRTEWEGFATATRAAAAGGVTTLVDMPLNSVPSTTDPAALNAKRQAAAGQCRVDVGFWGGVVPGNADRLEELARSGVLGFKAFLVPSGVDEFEAVGPADLERSLAILAEIGAVLLVHAEDAETIARHAVPAAGASAAARRSYPRYLASRPPAAERRAIESVLALARTCGARIHIVHLATPTALETLRRARREGLQVTVETCPALPDLRGRGDRRRGHRVQVRSADSRARGARAALGRPRQR